MGICSLDEGGDMMKHNDEITYCGYRKCQFTECRRYYKNAPFDVLTHWFAVRPKPGGDKCDYYLS